MEKVLVRRIRIDAPQVGMVGGDGSPVYRFSHQEEGMSKEENCLWIVDYWNINKQWMLEVKHALGGF